MQAQRFIILFFFFSFFAFSQKMDYTSYHQEVIKAENLIADKQFKNAKVIYQKIFNTYDFVFVKEYKIAAQLSMLLNEPNEAEIYIRKGMSAGWELKAIKRTQLLESLRRESFWKQLRKDYRKLHKEYRLKLNLKLRDRIKRMFSKDQWKALMAALKLSEKSQERYLKKRFIPHSKSQIEELKRIFESHGYPGEQHIGNNYWVSTIISHHNSITSEFTNQDSLFIELKPFLMLALKHGHMSPFEFATIDEWYFMTKNDDGKTYYGILEEAKDSELDIVNERRHNIGLRPIATRSKLIELQNDLGFNFYLDGDPWY